MDYRIVDEYDELEDKILDEMEYLITKDSDNIFIKNVIFNNMYDIGDMLKGLA